MAIGNGITSVFLSDHLLNAVYALDKLDIEGDLGLPTIVVVGDTSVSGGAWLGGALDGHAVPMLVPVPVHLSSSQPFILTCACAPARRSARARC